MKSIITSICNKYYKNKPYAEKNGMERLLRKEKFWNPRTTFENTPIFPPINYWVLKKRAKLWFL